MNDFKRNEYKNYISTALYMTVLLAVTGTILQTFMLELGFSEDRVAQAVSTFQMVQGTSMILLSGLAERVKNVIFVTAVGMLNVMPILLIMLFFGFSGVENFAAAYSLFLTAGIITNIVLGFYNVIVYKLPYHIMKIEDYGRITANSGVIQGILGIAISGIITYLINAYKYFTVMNTFLIVSIIISVISFLISISYKKIANESVDNDVNKKINVFKYRPFYLLLIPNITRGICFGFVNVAVAIGYYFKIIDSVSSGYIVIITNVGIILSCMVYSFFAKRSRNGTIILISSITAALLLPVMVIGKNTAVFLVAYGIIYFAINVSAIAIPVSVTEFVDYNVMGQYTAWRMMLMTIGTSIGGIIVMPMIELIGGVGALIFAAIMQMITGTGYYLYLKISRKKV